MPKYGPYTLGWKQFGQYGFRQAFGRRALGQGVGAWLTTKAALKTFLAGNVSADNPHSQTAMPSPPTITVSAGTAGAPTAPYTALTQAFLYNNGTLAPVALYEGGGIFTYLTNARRFPVATVISGGNVQTTENAVDWRASFQCNAAAVAIVVEGGASYNYRFLVDGRYVSFTPTNPSTGGRQYCVLDFGSKTSRLVTVEGRQNGALRGVHVAVGDTVTKPTAKTYRGIVLGDSFTAATGVTTGCDGDGFVRVLADYLGIELWASGSGGTGYVTDNTGAGYKLADRLAADIGRFTTINGRPPDIVVVPMGINDIGQAGVQAQASACLATIRALCPAALIFVLGPWDKNAPAAAVAGYSTTKAAIQAACAGLGGVWFIDAEGLEYTKSDATHPDDAGYTTIGLAENTNIRALIAA